LGRTGPDEGRVRDGRREKFVFYELREGRFKLDGEDWHEFVGSKIRVTGDIKKSGKRSSIKVDKLEVMALSIAEREAKDVIGRVVELKLNGLYGTGQDLGQFTGRIVILNFWATYCPPCIKEMPDLGEIQNEFGAFGVQVIGASADEPEDRLKVLTFIQETKVNFPIWLGADSSDMRRFGLGEALPGTVIIDRGGKVSRVISGVIDKEDIKKEIRTMLNGAVAEVPEADASKSSSPPVAKKAKRVSSVPS
jgi:thiol-disulfide isomerase/thioredoxin